jgi:isopentenyldiphosphate isomerase
MEKWDIYDKERVPTGRLMNRGDPFKPNEYHLVVHVCIFNARGEMLIQQRQPFKESWPDLWDFTVGGSALTDENSQAAATRELLEEIGLPVDLADDRPYITIHFGLGFDDYYILEKDLDISRLTLQYEEVQSLKWAVKEDILKMVEDGTFIPYYPSMIDLLFDMRSHRDARSVLDFRH